MLTRKVIFDALVRLGKDKDFEYENLNIVESHIVNKLLYSLNHVLSELCDLYPLKYAENVVLGGSELLYSQLSHNVYKIISIRHNGSCLSFREYDNKVAVDGNGEVEVVYSYRLAMEDIDDEISLPPCIDENILSLGVVADYCFIENMIDDAVMYDRRYREQIVKANKHVKQVFLKARRW